MESKIGQRQKQSQLTAALSQQKRKRNMVSKIDMAQAEQNSCRRTQTLRNKQNYTEKGKSSRRMLKVRLAGWTT